jgi:hypothetical protein
MTVEAADNREKMTKQKPGQAEAREISMSTWWPWYF